MKIVDLQVENTLYNNRNNIPDDIARLHYPQKYIILNTGELYDLEIDTVTDTAIYVKVHEKENVKLAEVREDESGNFTQ